MNGRGQEVRELIAGILNMPVGALADSMGIGDIPAWDSLAQVAIMTSLEEQYNLNLDFDNMMEATSVASIIALAEAPDTETPLPPSPPSPTAFVKQQGQPVVHTILANADKAPAKAALIFDDTALTYRHLAQGIHAAAHYLTSQGFSQGDTLALFAEKRKEFFYLYLGAHLIGATVLNVDPSINGTLKAHLFQRTHPRLSIGNAPTKADVTYDTIDFKLPAPFPPPPLPMETVADIMFTTGTTGDPKGVPLTHANLAAAARQINRFIHNTSEDIEVVALPICHSFGMGRIRCVLSMGGTAVLINGFSNTLHLLETLKDYQATGFAFVPAAWAYLQHMSGDKISQYAPRLRYIEIGSAPMPVAERQHLMQLFPTTRICMHYGLTEASRSTFLEFHSDNTHLDTAGKAVQGTQIAIMSETGAPCPPGVPGEICIHGEHVMKAYLGQSPEQCHYGSFFRTGDWGMLDADGYLHIMGRTRDIINTGGKKVSPDEIETVLLQMPGIADCACVAVPDPQGILGEVIKAVLVADTEAPPPGDQAIKAFAASKLEHHKVPTFIEWRPSLPKTSSGKIQRRLIN